MQESKLECTLHVKFTHYAINIFWGKGGGSVKITHRIFCEKIIVFGFQRMWRHPLVGNIIPPILGQC